MTERAGGQLGTTTRNPNGAEEVANIISIHSFRRGTGKSNLAANVAYLLAARGHRVGVIDVDLQSPGIHIMLGLDEDQAVHTLNHYLWDECQIEETVYDLSGSLCLAEPGRLFLVPASTDVLEISRMLNSGYEVSRLNRGIFDMIQAFRLDQLVLDTHAGMSEETLITLAISDALAIILRPDQQDFFGTAVMVDVARKLEVPSVTLVINNIPPTFDIAELKWQVEQVYQCSVVAAIPLSEEMMGLASASIFAQTYPEHPITAELVRVAENLGH